MLNVQSMWKIEVRNLSCLHQIVRVEDFYAVIELIRYKEPAFMDYATVKMAICVRGHTNQMMCSVGDINFEKH